MDNRSEQNFSGVHPDLVKVISGAAQEPQSFIVVCGVRSTADQKVAVQSGHSKTSKSRHVPLNNKCCLSCAVDVYEARDGKAVETSGDREEAVFTQIAKQVQASADALGIPIQWGGAAVGAWTPGVISHFRDWGHFQLPWKEYP